MFEHQLSINSPFYKLHPSVKIVIVIFYIIIIATTATSKPLLLLFLGFSIILSACMSGLPITYILYRSLVIIPFSLMIGLLMPFYIPGHIIARIPTPWLVFSISKEGLCELIFLLLKSWFSVLSVIILTGTTSFSSLIRGFNLLYMPKILVINISFMYRYLFLLIDEAMTMMKARDCRYFGGFNIRQVRVVGNMVAVLFIRTLEKSENIYKCMISRGFEGEIKTIDRLSMKWQDILFMIMSLSVIILLKVLL